MKICLIINWFLRCFGFEIIQRTRIYVFGRHRDYPSSPWVNCVMTQTGYNYQDAYSKICNDTYTAYRDYEVELDHITDQKFYEFRTVQHPWFKRFF
jgi:hypothetical protein